MPNVKPSVFSPGCGLAGFPQDKIVISKDSKSLVLFRWLSLVPHTMQRLVHPVALLDQVGTSRRGQIIWSAGSLCPPNFLTGPLFLNRGDPGTPQGKILLRTLSRKKPWRCWCTWRYHALITTNCCWKLRCHKLYKFGHLKPETVLVWCLTTRMYKAVCHSSVLAFANLSQNLHWTGWKINSFNMNVTVWTSIAGCLFVGQCLFLYLPKKKLTQAFRIFIISRHQF